MRDTSQARERFSKAMQLFEAALDQTRENRLSWVREQAPSDLVDEVMELLAAHEDEETLPSAPTELLTAELAPSSKHTAVDPEWIDRYRILERIAEGGMGTVYKAEQQEPMRRLVAVKLVRPGMDSSEVLARFDAERQALALMDHPNIARVFDGGLDESVRPFFVMEYVPGESLVSFCDQRQLSLSERLMLFVKVCSAVQHAHQKGVIHRDLKPSNVLVVDTDEGPEPKVIDFGIAKAVGKRLTNATLLTQHGLLLGTPEYMSPEQAAAGEADLDTRTDVYSLGVLLYELLVGCLPFGRDASRQVGIAEVLRMLREEDPLRPSARFRGLPKNERLSVSRIRASTEARLLRELARDLDWIVMRALEKDRQRRYPSVSEFAADVERYLAGDPVVAGPPSLSYRVSKFVSRHRLAVGSAATLAVVITAATVALGIQTTRLRTALGEAHQQAQRARGVSQVLVDAFQSADPLQRQADREVTAREVLDRAAEVLAVESLPAEDRAWLARSMGSAFLGINDLDRAEALLDDAVASTAESDRAALADARATRSLLYAARSQFDRALGEAELAAQLADQSGQAVARVTARLAVGVALDELGRFEEARHVLEEANAIADAAPDFDSALRAELALDLAKNAQERSDYEQALVAGRRAVDFAEQAWPNPLRHLESRFLLMRALYETGKRAQALEIAEQDYATVLERLGAEHPRTSSLRSAFALQLSQSPRIAEALPLHLENVALAKRLDPGGAHLPSHMNNLGLTQLGLGLLADAEETNREALRLQIELVGEEHPNVGYHRMNLGRVLHAQGRYPEAEQEYRAARALWTRSLPEGHTLRGNIATWLGGLLVETGRAGEGLPLIEEGLEIRESDRGVEDWQTAEARSWYGAALAETGNPGEAQKLLEEAYATIAEQRGPGWIRTRWAHSRVLHFHHRVGDPHSFDEWSQLWEELYGETPWLRDVRRWSLL